MNDFANSLLTSPLRFAALRSCINRCTTASLQFQAEVAPHIGGHTLESHVAMQDCVLANLDAFFAGKPLPYVVPFG